MNKTIVVLSTAVVILGAYAFTRKALSPPDQASGQGDLRLTNSKQEANLGGVSEDPNPQPENPAVPPSLETVSDPVFPASARSPSANSSPIAKNQRTSLPSSVATRERFQATPARPGIDSERSFPPSAQPASFPASPQGNTGSPAVSTIAPPLEIAVALPSGADVAVPAALAPVDPSDEWSPTDLQILDNMALDFADKVQDSSPQPDNSGTTPNQDDWNSASRDSDERFRAIFGDEALRTYQNRAALEIMRTAN